jgi:hypothetical protein
MNFRFKCYINLSSSCIISYSNIITSNYYTKVKNSKVTNYWNDIYGWEKETEKIKNECTCCGMSKNVEDIIYSRYWDAYLCEECNNTFV